MAKNSVSDWSTTAADNTDVGGIAIQGTNNVKNFDDALRETMAQVKADTGNQIRTDADQGLTTTQQAQGRANLGLPALPSFYAMCSLSAPQTVTGPVPFGYIVTNIGGHFGGTYFTAPLNGVYRFSVNIFFNLPNTNSSAYGRFTKNGAVIGATCYTSSISTGYLSYQRVPSMITLQLVAGDYIGWSVSALNNGAGVYQSSYSDFSGEFLG